MDIISFSARFSAATGVPVTLLEKGKVVYCSLRQENEPLPEAQWHMWADSRNPEFITQTANLCFTTGVGHRSPINVLHHDSLLTGQKVPAGITVFGPQNFNCPDDAFPRLLRADFLYPGAYVWPSFEEYLDIYRHPCVTEYTVQSSIGPNAYQWGYFAARSRIKK